MVDFTTVCVTEFIEAFDASKDPELWKKLINEEGEEVVQAFANLMKELCDLTYVAKGFEIVGGNMNDDADVPLFRKLEAIVDIMDAVPFDIRKEAFLRVHESNMSKLGEDGKPIRREDGKILKGPNYKPADLRDLI